MPRCVRNFWIELEVGGRKRTISAGPRGIKGGFKCNIYVREDGEVSNNSLQVNGYSTGGEVELEVKGFGRKFSNHFGYVSASLKR